MNERYKDIFFVWKYHSTFVVMVKWKIYLKIITIKLTNIIQEWMKDIKSKDIYFVWKYHSTFVLFVVMVKRKFYLKIITTSFFTI